MAYILPDTPPTHLPAEVLRVFRTLKGLPDSFFIWHSLSPWQSNTPDFLIIHWDRRVLLVKVSMANAVRPAMQLLLLDEDRPASGEEESKVLPAFVSSLGLPPDQKIETLVVFPNLSDAEVQAGRLTRSEGEPLWAGEELLNANASTRWLELLPTTSIDPLWVEKIRQRFTPEVVIPAEMTVRPAGQRRLEAGLTSYLLDYHQEKAIKMDLDLPESGQSLVNDFRLNIINGVAGSGKTLILLYRLRLLHRLYPHKRFLVLTHNRPLIFDMQSRFARLEGSLPENIEWRTFNGWCYDHWPKGLPWVQPLKINERRRLIEQVWQKYLQDLPISAQMFQSEIDWLKDQLPMNREAYLKVNRRGRGFGLTTEQRDRVFDAVVAYQKVLEARQTLDWGDVPRRLWHFSESGKVQLPQYDVVLIDEAQFFAPLWMQLIQKTLPPKTGHLFIVADPTQGFLGRGASWKSLGLEARGRVHSLKRSYRTTLDIMQFATLFYRFRLPEEKDDDILPPDLFNMPNGMFPEILQLDSPQDEITRVANEVQALVKQGFPKKDLLLLHTDGHGVHLLIKAINHRLGKDAARDPKTDYPGDYVRVTTLNAGAGLESPIVFLVGLSDLFESEQSLRLSNEERSDLIRDNTRKVYMAATRAGQRLVLTYAGELPDILKRLAADRG